MKDNVKKLPYTLETAHCNYDITKPQPQLFVTPDFQHLRKVLDEFIAGMAFKTGGLEGVRKAIASDNTGTCVYSSGLMVSGTFSRVISNDDTLVYLETRGPSALAFNHKQLKAHGKKDHPEGFGSPVGKLKNISEPLEDFTEEDLQHYGIKEGQYKKLEFETGLVVEGLLLQVTRSDVGKILLLSFHKCRVSYKDQVLENPSDKIYDMAVGEKIVSAFNGPADIEAFCPSVNVPREKTHKIVYNSAALMLHTLYKQVRKCREAKADYHLLPKIWEMVKERYPEDWLISLEIMEIFHDHQVYLNYMNEIRSYLELQKKRYPHYTRLIDDGLELIFKKEGV
jgi:phenylalanine-4-hydroxylase